MYITFLYIFPVWGIAFCRFRGIGTGDHDGDHFEDYEELAFADEVMV